LRPACASCIVTAIFACVRIAASTGHKAASVASSHRHRIGQGEGAARAWPKKLPAQMRAWTMTS
jgi:hypothetical protein